MKAKIFLVSMTALLLCFNLSSAADFEGKISQQSTSVFSYELEDVSSMSEAEKIFSKSAAELKQMAAQSGDADSYSEAPADVYIKGKAMRIDTRQDGQRVSMLFDGRSNKMTTLQHDDKMAMVIDMDQMMHQAEEMREQMAQSMGVSPDMMEDGMPGKDLFSIKPTGETKTINGFKCELYKGTDSDGGFTHMWIHKGYADVFESMATAFSRLDAPEKSGQDKEEQFFRKVKGVPILTKSLSNGAFSIDEILKISKQSVSDDMLKVPADYKKTSMEEMMQQQMKQMQEMMQQ